MLKGGGFQNLYKQILLAQIVKFRQNCEILLIWLSLYTIIAIVAFTVIGKNFIDGKYLLGNSD